jgi:hypothetical protein
MILLPVYRPYQFFKIVDDLSMPFALNACENPVVEVVIGLIDADKKPLLPGQKFCVRPRLSSEQSEPRGAGCKHGRFIKK